MKNTQEQKPASLRVIFILNALMGILPFVFYAIITAKGITIGNIIPIWMVYTGVAYIVSFAVLMNFILKRNILGARMIFLLNIGIALPTSAYLGIVVAIISLVLSFLNQPVKNYFSYQVN